MQHPVFTALFNGKKDYPETRGYSSTSLARDIVWLKQKLFYKIFFCLCQFYCCTNVSPIKKCAPKQSFTQI